MLLSEMIYFVSSEKQNRNSISQRVSLDVVVLTTGLDNKPL